MSEYQYVAFRAVDRPLTDAEIEFAEKQSTRADITRWSFTNEYHYGDFRGDVDGLLRCGYDVFLHYANFGIRHVALRLPGGMPFPKRVWRDYTDAEGFRWQTDRAGKGGILSWAPFHDAGSIDEIWEPEEYIDACAALRQRLICGDLRALYVIWLCTAGGDDADWQATEPPVPLGLDQFTEVAEDILDFFGLDPLILAAAAEEMPPLPAGHREDETAAVQAWIDRLSDTEVRGRLRALLTGDAATVRARLLAECRGTSDRVAWPTAAGTRTFEMLRARAETLRDEEAARQRAERERKAQLAAQAAERERKKRMKQMVAAPEPWLAEAERLADARGTKNYEAAVEILADLREAIGGDEGKRIAREHAAHLAQKHPTLTRLKSSLRKRGLWK